jgi:tRNA threonylcarbamoyl adenosine modification protein YeaZ
MDVFVVGEGPGSFTGLRIGFSIVKAFSLAYKRPVITLGSFHACAQQMKRKFKKIAVIADARRKLIYCGGFESNCGTIKRKRKEQLMTAKDCIKNFKNYQFITYDTYLKELFLEEDPDLSFYEKAVYPKAKYLALDAASLYKKKKFTPLARLKPLYLHPKTCQIRR